MQLSAQINNFRRNIMRRLTRRIGKSRGNTGFSETTRSEIKSILVCRPNHRLGNLLLVTPLLDELAETFPESRVDLFVKGRAGRDVFRNYTNVGRLIELPRKPFSNPLAYASGWFQLKLHSYDLVINVDKKSSSGRLSTKWANAKYRFYGDDEDDTETHLAKRPIQQLRLGLKKLGISDIAKKFPPLNLKLTWLELMRGKKKLYEIIGNERRTISLFTYATGEKRFSELWWEKFYRKLRAKYRDYNIIEILPAENVSQLKFKIPTLYSKDIREIGAVIANTDVFIGADSGIMHLASASGTPTVGLFSVTDDAKYEPYNANSVAINTSKSGLKRCFDALNTILAKQPAV